jgi:hypothetical protein
MSMLRRLHIRLAASQSIYVRDLFAFPILPQ